MHCFGHMHANWGAKKVAWREEGASDEPSHFTDIDNDRSAVIETLSTLHAKKFDREEDIGEKRVRRERYEAQRYCGAVDLRLEGEMETMFVNAAIEGEGDGEQHLPWIVELELRRAD